MAADLLIADKADDADQRVIAPLTAAGKPPSSHPGKTEPRLARSIRNSPKHAI
jgi:hypothetical protein